MIKPMHRVLSFAIAVCLSACVSGQGAPPPAPFRAPPAVPAVVQAPPPVQNLSANWQDWPAAQGEWFYRRDRDGTEAAFGPSASQPLFRMLCSKSRQRVYLMRAGSFAGGESGRMSVRTSSALQTYAVSNVGGALAFISADLATADPILDAMAFSRGKFVVSVKGTTDLVLPSWAEVTRLVEDCRT